jgi:predicted ribonuclease YlaK
VEEARQRALSALDKQCSLLDRLHDGGEGADVYLPDTNALLHHVDLERWAFPDSERFELVLGPSILVELDELKINHRNPDVRQKAERLISRIKGYRTRGQLTRGVPLRKPVSMIRAIATEPRLEESLPWLDPDSRDDRFIATVIEVIRNRPRSAVTIVTRDINLQSKAELASLPFVEPPDPA